MGSFFTVASVELGNTTTKCILTSTNLKTAEIFEIGKEVRMTRDVRPPKPGESVFGETIFGIQLTQEAVTELVSDVLTSVLSKAHLDLEKDLHFVVRSTGVTAGFAKPDEVGAIVKALADGCLMAGIPPRKMTAAISIENLPPGLREFSWLKKVYFDGAVASSLPPANTEVVANEMEGELVTAGIKGAVKGTDIDFRNPVMTLDFGTTLAGRITDDGYPYSKTIGSFVGLAGAIPDSLVRGSKLVEEKNGCALDLTESQKRQPVDIDLSLLEQASKWISIKRVPAGQSRFGTVPVDTQAAEESSVVLIGVDADLMKLEQFGSEISSAHDGAYLMSFIDHLQSNIAQGILSAADSEGLILPETSLGFTGRAIISGQKPNLITNSLKLENGTLWKKDHQIVFVEDGLAMGAAVAARCMNSLGTKDHPMGGRHGDKCIMAERMKRQKK